jgi:rubrerythrin
MTKSEENLKAAFAGESQANRKYLAFAKKADKEGFPQVAKIFRAAAEAETVHAHNHLRELGGIKSTKENVQGAIEGEHYEFTKMYPEFLEDAKEEGNKGAERSFDLANEVSYYLKERSNDLILKYKTIERELKGLSSVKLKFKNFKKIVTEARIQTIISLGDQEISELLLKYYQNGANYSAIRKAEGQINLSIDEYLLKVKEGYSPWDTLTKKKVKKII